MPTMTAHGRRRFRRNSVVVGALALLTGSFPRESAGGPLRWGMRLQGDAGIMTCLRKILRLQRSRERKHMRATRLALQLLLIFAIALLLATAFAGWKWSHGQPQAGWTWDDS